MYTQAATFVILGQSVYIYGLFLSVACLLAGSLLLLKTRKSTQQQKGAAAQNCERGEQKDPKFRLFHHVLIVGCPAGVVNGFLTWYNSLIFYRFL